MDANGAFAEYVVIPESNIWKLDPAIPQDYASILDPLGNAVHTVLAGDIAAKSVAITGCGPIGLFSIAVARACGATQIFALEVNEHRRKIAQQMKPDFVLDSMRDDVYQVVMDNTGGTGVDVVLEMAGRSEAIRTAFRILRLGGRISMLGIPSKPVELNFAEDVIFKGATVQGINGRPHVPDLVPDDRTAEGRKARPASGNHRPHRHEGLRQGHGAAEDRRGQQDPGVSQWEALGKAAELSVRMLLAHCGIPLLLPYDKKNPRYVENIAGISLCERGLVRRLLLLLPGRRRLVRSRLARRLRLMLRCRRPLIRLLPWRTGSGVVFRRRRTWRLGGLAGLRLRLRVLRRRSILFRSMGGRLVVRLGRRPVVFMRVGL